MPGEFVRTTERGLRAVYAASVGPEEIERLSRPRLAKNLLHIGAIWAAIVVLLIAANLFSGWSSIGALLISVIVILGVATRMNALGVVMHEASHGFLTKSRTANDWLCNCLASWWLFHSVQEYRPAHRLHHRYLGSERDPDRISSMIGERRYALALLVLEDLSGISALRKALVLWRAAEDDEPGQDGGGPSLIGLLGKCAAQLVVLGQFIFFQGLERGIVFYVVFWIFPLLCLFPLNQRLKTITEHFDPRLRDASARVWIARNSHARWLQNVLVGAQMEHHFEHHVIPTIPFWGLRELNSEFGASDAFEGVGGVTRLDIVSGGYVHFLVRRLPALLRDSRRDAVLHDLETRASR